MELRRIATDAKELIEASNVNSETKEACRQILFDLTSKAEKNVDPPYNQSDTVEVTRFAIERLYNLLELDGDAEKKTLFESLRNCILNARNSAKGWKSKNT